MKGITQQNSCETNSDCPSEFFCEKRENVCVSKLGPMRLCDMDEMCVCGKCIENKIFSRKGLKPIIFQTCNFC